MRNVWIVSIALMSIIFMFQGCTNQWTEESYSYYSPAWSPDGKIVYFEKWYKAYYRQYFFGVGEVIYRWDRRWVLKEMNDNGSGDKQIRKLYDRSGAVYPPMGGNISVSSDKIVFAYQPATYTYDKPDTMIYIINRDGTGLTELCMGKYPNFFAGGDSIIYEKPLEGIWVMDVNGSEQRQVISDSNAKQPDVDRNDSVVVYVDGGLSTVYMTGYGQQDLFTNNEREPDFCSYSDSIVYVSSGGILHVSDLSGGSRKVAQKYFDKPKWSPLDNKIIGTSSREIIEIKTDGSNYRVIKHGG